MTSIFKPSYDFLSLLRQRFDLTLKSPRTKLKKGYLLKLNQDLAQSFPEMFQSFIEIGLVNDIKQCSTIFLRFSFRS